MTQAKDLMPAPDREQMAAIEFEYARVLKGVEALMKAIGADPAQCKGCHAAILWVRHANGKLTPYDRDGTNHFITCPKAKQFKTEGS